eukprot:snap_masked-scaffold_23-processed-gene-0.29-mRNA-1 protein AED:1.00 eAED:1.00 QI:0/0/0/0/1/1/2/0/74
MSEPSNDLVIILCRKSRKKVENTSEGRLKLFKETLIYNENWENLSKWCRMREVISVQARSEPSKKLFIYAVQYP